jgi:formate--tetrahydrofolate ligase
LPSRSIAFPPTRNAELAEVRRISVEHGVSAAVVADAFSKGRSGAAELAEAVVAACEQPSDIR